MHDKNCNNCQHAKEAGYRQIICGKDNKFHVGLYSCDYFREKEEHPKKCGECGALILIDKEAGGGICVFTDNFHRFDKLCDQ